MSAVLTPPAPASVTPPPKGAPALGPRPRRWTLAEFDRLIALDLVQPRRHQLIRGEIIDVGDQSSLHCTIVDLVAELIRAVFGDGFYVRQAMPMRFGGSQPEPDVAVVRGKRADYRDAHPSTALLTVEVSHTTLTYDMTTKAELYATAAIPEYWVLDLEGKVLHVYREPQPLADALGATAYRVHTEHRPGESVQPLHAPNAVAVAALLE